MSERQTYNVNQGGLMRCCLATLGSEILRRLNVNEPLMRDGDTLRCAHHDGCGMICDTRNGKLQWRWNREAIRAGFEG